MSPRTPPASLVLLTATMLAACGGDGGPASDSPADESIAADAPSSLSVPVHRLGDPILEIGEFEGGGDQTLDLVSDAALLDGDLIAVVDRAAAVVLVYDTTGALVRTVGGEGDGPGEFRSPSLITSFGGDSLAILDAHDLRASVFDDDFEYVREFPVEAAVSGRFLLDGAVVPAGRETLTRVTELRPLPESGSGFGVASLADDGHVWIRERIASAASPALWFVLDDEATPLRAVEVPRGLRPLYMHGETVLARWEGDYGVHWVRRYDLQGTGRTSPVPLWLAERQEAARPTPMSDEANSALKALVRNLATEQEIYYATNLSYAPDFAELGGLDRLIDEEYSELLQAEILHADARGWSMAAAMKGNSGMCVLTFGDGAPIAVQKGVVLCTTPK